MDFLKISDVAPEQLQELLGISAKMKQEHATGITHLLLANKTLLLLFEKNSTRTRVSFEVAMAQLGGHSVFLDVAHSQHQRGESMHDTGASVGGMADFIAARLHSHAELEELAEGSDAPVINALTDLEHPCQALADLLTLGELGKLEKGNKIAFVGDCKNNVANSLMVACAMAGLNVSLAGPGEYMPSEEYVRKAEAYGVNVEFFTDAAKAAADADAVYTDTWVSMGDEADANARIAKFAPYQVNAKLMSYAKPDAIFMHCLPAHRGQEVSAEVIGGKQSVVFLQAQNRLHAQKGLLCWLGGHQKQE